MPTFFHKARTKTKTGASLEHPRHHAFFILMELYCDASGSVGTTTDCGRGCRGHQSISWRNGSERIDSEFDTNSGSGTRPESNIYAAEGCLISLETTQQWHRSLRSSEKEVCFFFTPWNGEHTRPEISPGGITFELELCLPGSAVKGAITLGNRSIAVRWLWRFWNRFFASVCDVRWKKSFSHFHQVKVFWKKGIKV